MKRNIFVESVIIIFMILFFYTAIHKLMVIPTLTYVLTKYPLIKYSPVLFAWALPIYELIIVGFLFFNRSVGLRLSAFTMFCFSAYVAYMYIFVPKLPCTCGGLIQQLNWPQHLAMNLALLLLAIIAIKKEEKTSVQHNRSDELNTSPIG